MARRAEGLFIGDVYVLTGKNRTEMIPRSFISYVSADYTSQPLLLALGIVALLLAAGGLLIPQFRESIAQGFGADPNAMILLAGVAGIVLLLLFLSSRRGGVMIVSSGGKIFVETRGRARLELVDQIRADLDRSNYAADQDDSGEGSTFS